MGLGKTAATLSAIDYLQNKKGYKSALIIAPLRVAYTSWPGEIAKWEHLQHMTYSIIHGENKADKIAANVQLYLINYEGLAWLYKFLVAALRQEMSSPWDILIIDESSKIKSHDTQRFEILQQIRPLFKKIVCLTGTPCPQMLWDIWSQTFMLDGGARFGKSFNKFKRKYFYQPQAWREYHWEELPGAKEKIQNKVRDITLSMKAKDYIDMPPLVYNDVLVPLPDKTRAAYRALEVDFFLGLENSVVTAESAAIQANKLRQVLQGGVYDENREPTLLNHAKVDALIDIAEDTDSNVLCMYQFRFEVDIIRKHVKDPVFFTGSATKDALIIKQWNLGNIKMLCVHPDSASHGLNIQDGGCVAVWLGLTWSLEQYIQANARLHRQGQKNPVVVHHIVVEDTVDDRVAKALRDKNATQESLINALKEEPNET